MNNQPPAVINLNLPKPPLRLIGLAPGDRGALNYAGGGASVSFGFAFEVVELAPAPGSFFRERR